MGDFKVTMSPSTLGMHDTLGNPLAIEVSNKVDVVEVYRPEIK